MKSDLILKYQNNNFVFYKIRNELAIVFTLTDEYFIDVSLLSAGKSSHFVFYKNTDEIVMYEFLMYIFNLLKSSSIDGNNINISDKFENTINIYHESYSKSVGLTITHSYKSNAVISVSISDMLRRNNIQNYSDVEVSKIFNKKL